MAEVNGGQLIQLGEGGLGDVLELIVGHIEELDTFLILHGDLREVCQLIEGDIEMIGVTQFIESILIKCFQFVM